MITVVKPNQECLNEVTQWPVWEKGPSQFNHDYTEKEIFYIIEGSAILKGNNGEMHQIEAGDLVTVEQGILVNWEITQLTRKHFKFFS